MTGKVDQHGNVTIECNPCNGDPLLSPDGKLHLLPCDRCGKPQWESLAVVANVCAACSREDQQAHWINVYPVEGKERDTNV